MGPVSTPNPPTDDPNCAVLAAVVAHYDDADQPVCPETVARTLGRDERAIRDRFGELVDCEFLSPEGDGYRPTVTGREFLALDIDCGPIVVDTDDE